MSGYWDLAVTLIVGVAALVWVLWQRRHPRIRAVDAEELAESRGIAREVRQWLDEPGDPTHEQIDQALGVVAEHPLHRNPADCIAPDLSAGFDVIAEPDHRRAEHMNRTLRRAEGGDET